MEEINNNNGNIIRYFWWTYYFCFKITHGIYWVKWICKNQNINDALVLFRRDFQLVSAIHSLRFAMQKYLLLQFYLAIYFVENWKIILLFHSVFGISLRMRMIWKNTRGNIVDHLFLNPFSTSLVKHRHFYISKDIFRLIYFLNYSKYELNIHWISINLTFWIEFNSIKLEV